MDPHDARTSRARVEMDIRARAPEMDIRAGEMDIRSSIYPFAAVARLAKLVMVRTFFHFRRRLDLNAKGSVAAVAFKVCVAVGQARLVGRLQHNDLLLSHLFVKCRDQGTKN